MLIHWPIIKRGVGFLAETRGSIQRDLSFRSLHSKQQQSWRKIFIDSHLILSGGGVQMQIINCRFADDIRAEPTSFSREKLGEGAGNPAGGAQAQQSAANSN